MRCLLTIAALAASLCTAASETSIPELIEGVRSGIRQHAPDKSLAKSVARQTLGAQLDLRTIEELESEGAGPETVAALDELRDKSAALPASTETPAFQSPARPSVDEQKEYFHKIDVNAMHYTFSLPDFICTEMVHRYQMTLARPPGSPMRRGQSLPPVGAGYWLSKDVLTVKLSYFENREKYQLILVNGHKTRDDYESSGGAISEGDFGSTLLEIFSPDSATKFQWDHWTHLRKRLTRVYSFRTSRERSHARIGVGDTAKDRHTVIIGRHGFIYADDETAMVMRIAAEADSIPLGFPITAQSSILDYDYANVGEKRFLLPLRVDNRLKTAQVYFKNVVEFKDYRKFTGESTISFDAPDVPGTPDAPPAQK
jgi:hypothetical protein